MKKTHFKSFAAVIIAVMTVLSAIPAMTASADNSQVPANGRTDLISPEYRADITDDAVTIVFRNNLGKWARAYSQKQPENLNAGANGSKELVAEFYMAGGEGSFDFPASEFPLGPITVRVDVFGSDEIDAAARPIDTAYFQFFNYSGIDRRGGIDKAPVNPVTAGMTLTFADNFESMPNLWSPDGNRDGRSMGHTGGWTPEGMAMTADLSLPRSYATVKVDGTGMFGWAFFSGAFPEDDARSDDGESRHKYNPFKLVPDGQGNNYMRLNTAYWPDAAEGVGYEINDNRDRSWGQKATTGYLSSLGIDGSGFYTQGGSNQYFETRMFFGPNPAHWPAFWTLTSNGAYYSRPDDNGVTPWGAPVFGGPSDELDILEAYLGNPEGYQVAYHEWGYSTGKGGGKWVNLNQEIFGHANITEGFHTLAMYITEKTTYYYCDNILVFEHETLQYSWELGNYFIINGGLSDHYGLPQAGSDRFGPEHQPFGFTRYGNECYDYIDWIRVWEDAPLTPRFETQKHTQRATPGDYVFINIDRNEGAQPLSGSYEVVFPAEGWEIWTGAEFSPANGVTASVAFGAGSSADQLLFKAPAFVEDGSKIEVTVLTDAPIGYTPKLSVTLAAAGEKGAEVSINRDTFPLRGKAGQTSGAWENFDPEKYEQSYFTFGGGWWNEGWSWMHNRSNSTGAVTFTFTGNAFELYHIAWSNGADYRIEFDGVYAATIETQSASDLVELGWSWEDPSGEDKTHVVRITCGEPYEHDWHVRLDTFRYWYHEDPNIAKYSIANTYFEASRGGPIQPGDVIDIIVDRNMGSSSIYGSYAITLPDYSGFGDQGYKIIDNSSGVHRPQETIKIQLPSHPDWVGRIDTILIDPPGSGHKTLSVTVKSPDPTGAPPITGDNIRRVDSSTYPASGHGHWSNVQTGNYFTAMDGGWWNDGWGWLFTQSSPGQYIDFTFEGDAVALYVDYYENGPTFDVYLDGVRQGGYDSNGSTPNMRAFSIGGLAPGKHTLRVVVTSGVGHMRISGFEYNYAPGAPGDESVTTIINSSTYPTSGGGHWRDVQVGNYFDVSDGGWWSDSWGWMYTNAGGDQTLGFSFTGHEVGIKATMFTSGGGSFTVSIDGAVISGVIGTSGSDVWNGAEVFKISGLEDRPHTLTVNVIGAPGTTIRFTEFYYVTGGLGGGEPGEPAVTGVFVKTKPQTAYLVNEIPDDILTADYVDLSRLVLSVRYSDMSSLDIAYDGGNITVDSIDSLGGGRFAVNVGYGGYTASYEVLVTNVLNAETYPCLGSGNWADIQNGPYFTNVNGGWWNEGWGWMHTGGHWDQSIDFNFTGSEVWIKGGEDYGAEGEVWIDGEFAGLFNLENTTWDGDVIFHAAKLEPKAHVLTLKVVKNSEWDAPTHLRLTEFGVGILTECEVCGNKNCTCVYCGVCGELEDDCVCVSDADFLRAIAADILKNGLTEAQLVLSANNKATLTLVIGGKEFVLAANVNNRNVSGQIELPDGSGILVFDIKGNGSNVKVFEIIPK